MTFELQFISKNTESQFNDQATKIMDNLYGNNDTKNKREVVGWTLFNGKLKGIFTKSLGYFSFKNIVNVNLVGDFDIYKYNQFIIGPKVYGCPSKYVPLSMQPGEDGGYIIGPSRTKPIFSLVDVDGNVLNKTDKDVNKYLGKITENGFQ